MFELDSRPVTINPWLSLLKQLGNRFCSRAARRRNRRKDRAGIPVGLERLEERTLLAAAITAIDNDTTPVNFNVAPYTNDFMTNDTSLVISGTAVANAQVTLREGNFVYGTFTADANGLWSTGTINFDLNPNPGHVFDALTSNVYTLTAVDQTGATNRTITIRTAAPVPLTVSSPYAFGGDYSSGTQGTAQSIPVSVRFDEPVLVSVPTPTAGFLPTIPILVNQTAAGNAVYPDPVVRPNDGGSGTDTLNFILQTPALTGLIDNASPLSLNTSTISDVFGNLLVNNNLPVADPLDPLNPTNPNNANSLISKGLTANTINTPHVISVNVTNPNNTYAAGNTLTINVTFDRNVQVNNTAAQLILDAGLVSGVPAFGTVNAALVNPNTVAFTYNIVNGHNSIDLDAVSLNNAFVGAVPSISTAGQPATAANAAASTVPRFFYTPGAGAFTDDVRIDTAPTVLNVTSPNPNTSDTGHVYTTGEQIDIVVTLSEAVVVSGTPTIALALLNNAGALNPINAVYLQNSQPSRQLTFRYTIGTTNENTTDLDYNGTGALVTAGGSIVDVDLVPTNAVLTLPAVGGPNSISGQKSIQVDTNRPLVPITPGVNSTIANGTYGAGEVIPVTVTFNDAVFVNTLNGIPTITLVVAQTGQTTRQIPYTSGSGTNTLTFNYTVQPGDASPDLDYQNTTALQTNGGTIRDNAGLDATLTLPAPGAAGSLGGNKAIVIDTVPAVTTVTSSVANGSYGAGSVIPIRLQFNKLVDVVGNPQLTIRTGASQTTTLDFTGKDPLDSRILIFNYTVQPGDNSTDLDYATSAALQLNGGAINGTGGGAPAILTLPSPGGVGSLGFNKNIIIDTTPPSVVSVSSTATNRTYRTGELIPIQVTFTEPVFVTGNPQLILETNLIAGQQSGIGGDAVISWNPGGGGVGSGTTTLTFNYIVQPGQNSSDLATLYPLVLPTVGDNIRDGAAQPISGTGLVIPPAAALQVNKDLVVDGSPTVVNVSVDTNTIPDGTYIVGQTIPIRVTFSEPIAVIGTGNVSLTLETNGIAGIQTGAGGDAVVPWSFSVVNSDTGVPNATMVFNYTVGASDFSVDLDYASTGALTISGPTTIRDQDGVNLDDANLSLPTPVPAQSAIIFTPGTTTNGSIAFSRNIKINSAVNDPPTIVVPATLNIVEDQIPSFLGTIRLEDVDDFGGTMQISLSVTNGTLTLSGTSGLSFAFSDGLGTGAGDGTADAAMTFRGSRSSINAALTGMTFTPTAEFPSPSLAGAAVITINANDLGNADGLAVASTGTALPAIQRTVTINITADNDAPTLTVPGPQSTQEDMAKVFSFGNGNQISIADADAGNGSLTVTLTALNGTFTLASTTGITGAPIGPVATMQISGTLFNLNNALNGLSFLPDLNLNNPATLFSLTVTVSDNGNSPVGAGNVKIDGPKTIDISVSAMNDRPTVLMNGSVVLAGQGVPVNTPRFFNAANSNRLTITDVDAAPGTTFTMTLTGTHGVLSLDPNAISLLTGLGGLTGDGTDETTITFTGSLAVVNAALDNLKFTPETGYVSSSDTALITITADDAGSSGSATPIIPATIVIAVGGPNQAPVLVSPATRSTTEGTPITFTSPGATAITVSDADAGATDLKVTISGPSGAPLNGRVTLNLATATISFVGGVGDGVDDSLLTFFGSQAQINAALNGMIYDGTADFNGLEAMVITVDDLGHSGTGTNLTATRTVNINITALNDAPVTTIPAVIPAIDEDTQLVFSSATGNQISINDPDILNANMRVTLSVVQNRGTLTLKQTAGLVITTGTGTNDTNMIFTGRQVDVNAALNGLIFRPALDEPGTQSPVGTVSFTIDVNDQGNTPGPAMSAVQQTVTVTLNAVNDAPVVNIPVTAQSTNEDIPLPFNGTISVADVDAGNTAIEVTMTALNGRVQLSGVSGITFINNTNNGETLLRFLGSRTAINTALNGAQFIPNQDLFSPTTLFSLTVRVDDLGNSGASVVPKSDTKTFNITVNPVNDPPTMSQLLAKPQGAIVGTPFLISYSTLAQSLNEADVDGDQLSFRIAQILSGTLSIQGGGPVIPGTTNLNVGQTLIWTPPAGVKSTASLLDPNVGAFSVQAIDPSNSLSAPPIRVNVEVINSAPTLTTVATLMGGSEDITYNIPYSVLLANSNAFDPNGDQILFRIDGVTSGVLTKNGLPVIPGPGGTTLGPSESLVWSPPSDANGTRPAFRVSAFDGELASPTSVQVSINLASVNDLPSLSIVNPLSGTQAGTPFTIPYSMLAAASDIDDVDNHPAFTQTLFFRIRALINGSLILAPAGGGTVAVVAGPNGTIVGPGDSLIWTAPVPSSAGTNLATATSAFSVTAFDGALDSPAPVTVPILVANTPPTLTTIATLVGAAEDTAFPITFSVLQAAADEDDVPNNVAGNVVGFRIESVTTGTLVKLPPSGSPPGTPNVPVVPGVTTFLPNETLSWLGALDANGTQPAFVVTAFDGISVSGNQVQVNISMSAFDDPPTLSTFNTIPNGRKNLPITIDYSTLLSASNVSDPEGDPIYFQVSGISSGSLSKNNVAVGLGTNIAAGESIVWTPPVDVIGPIVNAFSLVAIEVNDSSKISTTSGLVSVSVVNDPPTLSVIAPLTGGFEDTQYTVTYAALLSSSNAVDPNGDAISFVIGTVTNGSLTKNGSPIVPGTTTIANGELLVWTPPVLTDGTIPAFTVFASDGDLRTALATQVFINLSPVNHAPTFTTFTDLQGAVGFQPYPITYSALLQASNAVDVDGDTIGFRIESINSGTLTRGGIPVAPGSTIILPGQTIVWTSPPSTTGVLNAFSIVATDPSLADSTPPVNVTISVANSAPILTTVSTLAGGQEDTTFAIPFDTLLNSSNAIDPNGDLVRFKITSISSGGTLTKNGATVIPGTTTFNPGETLFWTPPPVTNGVLSAFSMVANDGQLDSASPVQVTVNVTHVNHTPTLTTIATLSSAISFQPFNITYATLAASSNAVDLDNDTISFRIEAVSSGTLLKNGVPVLAGTTLIGPNEAVTWTSPKSTFGVLPAFTVRAFDGQVASTSAIQVRVTTNNTAPTLTSIATLNGGTEDVPFTIPFATLLASSNAQDANGDTIGFGIESVTTGSLTKNGAAVIPGTTKFNANDTLVWTPTIGADGIVPAFTVRAFDGQLSSSPTVQVNINLLHVNHPPTMTNITPLGFVLVDAPSTITYDQLRASTNANDVDGDPISFRIDLVVNGSLTKNGSPVINGLTTFGPGESLIYTPSPGTHGVTSAFTVSATDGQLFTASQIVTVDVEGIRLLRAYNPNAAYHFFTTSVAEFNNAVAHGYRDETTGRAGFAVLDTPQAGVTALHRLRNPNTGKHYYTPNTGEKDFLVGLGWRYEKDEGFIPTVQLANSTEIYKLYNNISGTHLYTENAGTRDAILAQFPGIWVPNTSLGFGFPVAASSTPPSGGGGSSSGGGTGLRAVAAPVVAQAVSSVNDAVANDDLSRTGADQGLAEVVTHGDSYASSADSASIGTASANDGSAPATESTVESLDNFWNDLGQALTNGSGLNDLI